MYRLYTVILPPPQTTMEHHAFAVDVEKIFSSRIVILFQFSKKRCNIKESMFWIIGELADLFSLNQGLCQMLSTDME